jgi:hypothetical protein
MRLTALVPPAVYELALLVVNLAIRQPYAG